MTVLEVDLQRNARVSMRSRFPKSPNLKPRPPRNGPLRPNSTSPARSRSMSRKANASLSRPERMSPSAHVCSTTATFLRIDGLDARTAAGIRRAVSAGAFCFEPHIVKQDVAFFAVDLTFGHGQAVQAVCRCRQRGFAGVANGAPGVSAKQECFRRAPGPTLTNTGRRES